MDKDRSELASMASQASSEATRLAFRVLNEAAGATTEYTTPLEVDAYALGLHLVEQGRLLIEWSMEHGLTAMRAQIEPHVRTEGV